ncbi:MAG: hypothetical protein L7W43_18255 [Rubripirellula sp.]|nr:hypothetical protein [Rubripirellula sp.]
MTAPIRPKIRGERLHPTQRRSGESTNLSTKQAIRWRESWWGFLGPRVAGYKVDVSSLVYTNRRRLRHYPHKNEGLYPDSLETITVTHDAERKFSGRAAVMSVVLVGYAIASSLQRISRLFYEKYGFPSGCRFSEP